MELITGGVDYGAFGCDKTFHFIIKNINDKKRMEQQIAQADKLAALGELSAGLRGTFYKFKSLSVQL